VQNQHSSDSNLPQPVADVRVGRPTPSFGTAPDSRGGGTWHGAGQVRAAERTLRDYLDIMIRRRWLLLCVLAGSIVITAVYTYTATKYYSSTAVIEIEAKKQREQAKVSSASDYDEFQRYFLTQQEILRSRHLVETLVNEMNLTQSPEFSTRKVSWFDALLEGHGSKEVPVEEKGDTVDATTTLGVVNTLVRRISVKPVRTSNLISVTVDATTPEMAQQLLQNLLRLYLRNNLEIRRQESK